jgi:hypothetical protein
MNTDVQYADAYAIAAGSSSTADETDGILMADEAQA